MSSICASGPYLARTSLAAFRTAARLRLASARRGLSSATDMAVGEVLTSGTSIPYGPEAKPELDFHLPEIPVSEDSAVMTRKGAALALLAAAQFVVVLDASIVNVALPSIGTDLHFSQDDLSWVVNAYT